MAKHKRSSYAHKVGMWASSGAPEKTPRTQRPQHVPRDLKKILLEFLQQKTNRSVQCFGPFYKDGRVVVHWEGNPPRNAPSTVETIFGNVPLQHEGPQPYVKQAWRTARLPPGYGRGFKSVP